MEAFVTLATNDSYSLGACVWAYSLRRTNTTRKLAVMITEGVSSNMRDVLQQLFDHVEVVNMLHSGDPTNLTLLERQDLGSTFTKLHCWQLTQYTKAVFMDADTLVLRNIDDLFEREEFSAAPDPGWPDCFNSGVFVFRPSTDTYTNLVNFAKENGSFDGADQGLLNRYFSDWATKDISRHIPFAYNCVFQAFYSYRPAMKEFRSQVRVVHFIGAEKPWHHSLSEEGGQAPGGTTYRDDFLRQWWSAYQAGVRPLMSHELPKHQATVTVEPTQKEPLFAETHALSKMVLEHHGAPDQSGLSDEQRQERWAKGEIDFTGADKFANIQNRLDDSIKK